MKLHTILNSWLTFKGFTQRIVCGIRKTSSLTRHFNCVNGGGASLLMIYGLKHITSNLFSKIFKWKLERFLRAGKHFSLPQKIILFSFILHLQENICICVTYIVSLNCLFTNVITILEHICICLKISPSLQGFIA